MDSLCMYLYEWHNRSTLWIHNACTYMIDTAGILLGFVMYVHVWLTKQEYFMDSLCMYLYEWHSKSTSWIHYYVPVWLTQLEYHMDSWSMYLYDWHRRNTSWIQNLHDWNCTSPPYLHIRSFPTERPPDIRPAPSHQLCHHTGEWPFSSFTRGSVGSGVCLTPWLLVAHPCTWHPRVIHEWMPLIQGLNGPWCLIVTQPRLAKVNSSPFCPHSTIHHTLLWLQDLYVGKGSRVIKASRQWWWPTQFAIIHNERAKSPNDQLRVSI